MSIFSKINLRNKNRLIFIILSILGSSVNTLLVLYLNISDIPKESQFWALDFFNNLLITIGLTNLSFSQLLQKRESSKAVLKSLIIILTLFLASCIVAYAILPEKVIFISMAIGFLYNITELLAVYCLFNDLKIQSVIMTMVPRIIIALFIISYCYLKNLQQLIFALISILVAYNLFYYFHFKINTINYYRIRLLKQDIYKLNLVNLSNTLLSFTGRIYIFPGLDLNGKFIFEYLLKGTNLILLIFDFWYRYDIERLTLITLYRKGFYSYKYFLKKYQFVMYFLISGALIISSYFENLLWLLLILQLGIQVIWNHFIYLNILKNIYNYQILITSFTIILLLLVKDLLNSSELLLLITLITGIAILGNLSKDSDG